MLCIYIISLFYHLCLCIYLYVSYSTCVVVTVTPCVAVIVCDVEFGCWVCVESWLAIKDSLTHRPGSQGWVPMPVYCSHVMSCVAICECVLYGYFGICGYNVGGDFYGFL